MSIRIGIGRIAVYGGTGSAWTQYWADKTPTTLALTNVGYPEGIQLDWLNAGAGYDGTSIERSADGVTYAEIDTVASGVLTYQDLTAVFGSTYYYRVRCYKGTNYSPYSNAESLEVTSDRFMITVDTTKAGSAADTFVLPLPGADTYDYYVDWGEGGAEEHFVVNTSQTHVYAVSGTYLIKIRGTFPRIYFNGAGDRLKLMYIDNWGSIAWSSFANAFQYCANMQGRWSDTPDMTSVTSMTYMFFQCSVFNYSLNDWDVSNVTNMARCFYADTAYAKTIDNWNTSSVQDAYRLFRGCALMKYSFANFEIQSATNLQEFLATVDINSAGTANYDATLISWSAQAVTHAKTALVTNFGASKYGEGLVDSGTTDGVAANKLIQSGQNFNTTVTVGDVVYNTTDGTYAFVTAIDSDTQLSISVDIMASGEVYRIQHSDAAKARAQLVIPVISGGQGWTIADGGYV